MFNKYTECKNMFGNLITFSVLLSVFINCQACGALPLAGTAEGVTNGGNQWSPSYENPLFRRYHGPGTDFAVRRYPAHFPDQGDIANNDGIEVKKLTISYI